MSKCLQGDINISSLYDVKNANKEMNAGKSVGMNGLGIKLVCTL